MSRNLLCLLPDGHIEVGTWEPHPCGGYYEVERWVWGPAGRVGYSVPSHNFDKPQAGENT